ncbi:MAG: alpha/beta hydrolase [Pseudomonadota bacterium]
MRLWKTSEQRSLDASSGTSLTAPPTLVLVPGAWHGPWALEPLAAKLADIGIDSKTVTTASLDGKDKRGIPADVQATIEVIEDCPGDVVLVGHSYSGVVITEAGAHERVKHLVYLAAFMPKTNETANGQILRALVRNPFAKTLAPAMSVLPGDKTLLQLNPELAAKHLYGDCDARSVQHAQANLQLHNRNVFEQSPKVAAWENTPSTYIVCKQDKAIPPKLQKKLAKRANRTIELDTSHSPFYSDTIGLSAILAEIVG